MDDLINRPYVFPKGFVSQNNICLKRTVKNYFAHLIRLWRKKDFASFRKTFLGLSSLANKK